MALADDFRALIGFGPTQATLANEKLAQAETMAKEAHTYVQEGLMTMLSIAIEDRGWIQTDGFERDKNSNVLSFKAVQSAARNSRALISGNPVIAAAAQAKMSMVWSNPVRFTNTGNLLKSRKNRREVFGKSAQLELMRSKMADGNVFFSLDPQTQTVEIIPMWQIQGAVYATDNPAEILYFYRVWWEIVNDFETHAERKIEHKRLYKNADFETGGIPLPERIADVDVEQIKEIYHFAANRFKGQAWGTPDLLAGIFYAAEHKELIEAADSIYRAQSQYAITYKTKTRKALEAVAAHIASPAPVDPRTGQSAEYGQSVGFGSDIEMQLLSKIGAGIDFANFDPIAALASSVLGVPINVVLGKEEPGKELPATTLRIMRNEQQIWDEVFHDIFEFFGKSKAKTYWPPIDPDATHRQIQSIVGIAALKIVSPEEVRGLARDSFGADWEEKVPDPSEWEPFSAQKVAPGSTEPNGGAITPGQGQTGKLGKLADGDHELRDAGQQEHTQK